jgi:hypothetical protein
VGRVKLAMTSLVIGGAVYLLVVSGELTLDTGVGRRVQPLRPLSLRIAAPRETVFDVIAAPYLDRTPRAMAEEIQVLERGSDVVLAAHRTSVGWGMTTTTVETVRFERPHTVGFRLLRGPVPHVVEHFRLDEDAGSTRLSYEGELGTDFCRVSSATTRRSPTAAGAGPGRRGSWHLPDFMGCLDQPPDGGGGRAACAISSWHDSHVRPAAQKMAWTPERHDTGRQRSRSDGMSQSVGCQLIVPTSTP